MCHKHAVEVTHRRNADDVDTEEQPIVLRINTEMTDVDDRRLRNEGIHRHIEERHAEGIHHEGFHPYEPPIALECRTEALGRAFFVRQRLRQEMHGEKEQYGNRSHQPENHAPTTGAHEKCTEQWSRDRRRRHNEDECREHCCRLTAGVEITHHRAAEHRADTCADGLYHTESDDGLHRGCQCAADRSDEKEQCTDRERNATTNMIADRPPDELGNGKANEEARDRQGYCTAKVILHRRHRGQVDVRRQRGECHKGT